MKNIKKVLIIALCFLMFMSIEVFASEDIVLTEYQEYTDEYIEYIYPLFEYPEEIRKIIYTTNPIESLNSALRKVTRGKGSFINEQALMKVLYLRVENLEKKWCKGSKNWRQVENQLSILFEERYTKYL